MRKRVAKKTQNKKRTTNIRAIARQVIAQQAEHKIVSEGFTSTNFNSGITSNSELYPAFPSMSRGQSNSSRNGDNVRARWLILKGRCRISNTATAPQPKIVSFFVLEDKENKDCNAGSSYAFLNDGNGGDTNYDGSVLKQSLPVNTDRYIIHKRIEFRLTQDKMAGSTQSNTVDPWGTIYKEFNIRINMKNFELRYDNSGNFTLPENKNIFFALGYVNYDGAIDVALQDVELTLQRTLYFRD